MSAAENAERARVAAATTFPIQLRLPLGDGNWDKSYMMLQFLESGEVSWDAAGFKERETEALNGLFGAARRLDDERGSTL